MQKDDQFYRDMQKYIAITTVGPSALRNQGSKGVIKAAQKHLAGIDLQVFRRMKPSFLPFLISRLRSLGARSRLGHRTGGQPVKP
jgi:hypothetical protein